MRIVIDLQGAQTESRFRGIGRYSLSLALAIVRNAGNHEVWFVLSSAFPDSILDIRHAFDGLIPAERIRVFEVPTPVAEHDSVNAWRSRAAEKIREYFILQLRPDVLLLTSLFEGYVDDAVTSVGAFSSGIDTAVILYDLIPLMSPAVYLPTRDQRQYYDRKIQSLKSAGLLLAISEYSRLEAIDSLGLKQESVVNISAAIDPRFKPGSYTSQEVVALYSRFGITRKMVVYAPGGFDQRKNFDGLINAYALLSSELRANHQLVIVSKVSDADRSNLQQLRKQAGLAEDELVLTGYVSDDDLVMLYSLATLFVFPSKHEGFGLPPLEAMACGVPTIGSNTTSVPEVIGWAEALFDPASVQSITNKMTQVLTDDELRGQLREHGLQQAERFSWDHGAKHAIAAFERFLENRPAPKPASWAEIAAEQEHAYRLLINAIADIPQKPIGPSDEDLIAIATCLASNRLQTDRIARFRELPGSIAWRIEGPFDSSYSLALLNRETALALDDLGHQVSLHSAEGAGDFPPNKDFLRANPDIARIHAQSLALSSAEADVTSRNLYPPRVADMDCRMNLLHHYAWEESGFPQKWVENFNEHLQGVTCLSNHVGKIMIDHGVTVPMSVSGCGVDHWERIAPDECYRIKGKSFRFLHVSSCFPRKGADLLLKAYGRMFTSDDDVTLVIKTFPNPHNEIHQWLADACAERSNFPDVLIIEEDLTDAQLKSLYEQCHVLVAPSRAEGFGLPMAEAMLSGLAVITTGWGGQLDFCNENTAWLIDYSFQPAETHFGLFGSVWAEPSQMHLAQTMLDVYELPLSERRAKSDSGRALLLSRFKWKDVALKLVDSARSFSSMHSPTKPKIGWITTWNTKCGIATYSSHLISNMPTNVAVLAAHTESRTAADGPEVIRCWEAGEKDTLDELSAAIESSKINTLVVQFNYGFFNFENFSNFLTKQVQAGRVVVVVLHATTDPLHAPHKCLALLAASLKGCHRILVHAPGDLNRLKAIGLIDNVALFPHGVVDWPDPQPTSITSQFTIASYGFFLPHKGLPQLIDAVSLLVSSGRDIRLKMVNAEYPIAESRALIEEAKKKTAYLGLADRIVFISDFLDDHESLAELSASDLIVFPYQNTGESASGAVRYGLATGRAVAVTPLAIFDDVSRAVFYLPGQSPAEIAQGIGQLIDNIAKNDQLINAKQAESDRWRSAHRYSKLGLRLHNILSALGANENVKRGI